MSNSRRRGFHPSEVPALCERSEDIKSIIEEELVGVQELIEEQLSQEKTTVSPDRSRIEGGEVTEVVTNSEGRIEEAVGTNEVIELPSQ